MAKRRFGFVYIMFFVTKSTFRISFAYIPNRVCGFYDSLLISQLEKLI